MSLQQFPSNKVVSDAARAIVREDCRDVVKNRTEQLAALKNQTIVITGGTGFIGTWLAELVTCLNDDYRFGTKAVLVARSTDQFRTTKPHLANRGDVTFLKADVRHLLDMPKETNWVVHAASSPDNRFHASNPIETMMGIADGTAAVLRAVDRCSDLRMFLNISSGLIYGDQPLNLERVSEKYSGSPLCHAPTSAYAEAKRYGEALAVAARSQARIPAINVRPFAFIGPYQSLDTPWAINNFLWDSLNGNPIKVLGDGQTVRSYMYPSDAAFWILSMLTNAKTGSVYNIGSPEAITLEKLAQLVASYFSPKPEIVLRVSSVAQQTRFVPDVTSALEQLGLKTTVSLEKSLTRTIEWHRK